VHGAANPISMAEMYLSSKKTPAKACSHLSLLANLNRNHIDRLAFHPAKWKARFSSLIFYHHLQNETGSHRRFTIIQGDEITKFETHRISESERNFVF